MEKGGKNQSIHDNFSRDRQNSFRGKICLLLAGGGRQSVACPWHCPCTQSKILSLHASPFSDKVLEVEQDLKSKNYESQLFLAKVDKNVSLLTRAKNNWGSWFFFLKYHSTSKTLSPKEGV